jgi:hypothetical protein
MRKYQTAYFMLYFGTCTGGTCTLTLTVVPCDDAAATNTTTAIGFYYKRVSAGETNTAWTSSSSLLTTAGNDQMYVIKVNAADLPLVSNVTYEYCYLNVAETTDDPALGGVIVMMADPRYDEATLDAVTA